MLTPITVRKSGFSHLFLLEIIMRFLISFSEEEVGPKASCQQLIPLLHRCRNHRKTAVIFTRVDDKVTRSVCCQPHEGSSELAEGSIGLTRTGPVAMATLCLQPNERVLCFV